MMKRSFEALNHGHLNYDFGGVQAAEFAGYRTTKPDMYAVLADDPEVVVRAEPCRGIIADSKPEVEANLSRILDRKREGLRGLAQHGIQHPNYMFIGFEKMFESIYIYTGANKVHGKYFCWEHLKIGESEPLFTGWEALREMPEAITIDAVAKMLDYYHAVARGEIDIFYGDLRLSNLMHGRLQGDYADDLYMFDLQQSMFFTGSVDGYAQLKGIIKTTDGRGWGINYDLNLMEHYYGHEYPELRERVDKIHALASANMKNI